MQMMLIPYLFAAATSSKKLRLVLINKVLQKADFFDVLTKSSLGHSPLSH